MKRAIGTFLAFMLGCAIAVAQDTSTQLGESYRLHAAGDLAGATRVMRSVVDAKPSDYFSRLRLAYLQLLAGDYAPAAENYGHAADLSPGAIEPRLGQQQALLALSRFEESERAGYAALKLDEHNYLAISRLAWSLMQRKQLREATNRYSSLVDLYPGDVDMRLGLAHALLLSGRRDEAARSYREVLAMVPGHKSAAEGLAACR